MGVKQGGRYLSDAAFLRAGARNRGDEERDEELCTNGRREGSLMTGFHGQPRGSNGQWCSEGKRVQMHVWCRPEERDFVRQRARDENLSMGRYLLRILAREWDKGATEAGK